jgi:hypothetical protein
VDTTACQAGELWVTQLSCRAQQEAVQVLLSGVWHAASPSCLPAVHSQSVSLVAVCGCLQHSCAQ